MSDAGNPLPARVMVNRIWLHLFGDGLVHTTDDFGFSGDPPTHPELLDWLTVRFVEDGWSVKKMIRLLMLSRVYRLRSENDPRSAAVDPENRLRWRMNRRRLDAEAIRDVILAVSGRLDRTVGGPAIPKSTKTELGYKHRSIRRSIYVPVFRNVPDELLDVFDFANPNLVTGSRSTSTLPTQALYLMNSPFVMEQSQHAARSLLSSKGLDRYSLIDLAFRRALGRKPAENERKLAREYLEALNTHGNTDDKKQQNAELAAWSRLLQALFCSVDFRYID